MAISHNKLMLNAIMNIERHYGRKDCIFPRENPLNSEDRKIEILNKLSQLLRKLKL